MNKKQNLLILGPHYDTFIKGSGEELSTHYNKIFVIIPKWKKLFGFKKIFKTDQREFYTSKKNITIYRPEITPILPIAAKQLSKFLEKNNIKTKNILSHFLIPYGYLGNKLAKKNNTKSNTIIHRFEIYDFGLKNKLLKKIFNQIYKKTTSTITVSHRNLKDMKKLVKNTKKTKVIYNGFNDQFKEMNQEKCRKELGIPINKKIIINVANYKIEHKNQINLIKTAIQLRKKRTDFIIYLIGRDAGDKNKIKQTIRELKANKYIIVTGPKKHEDIPKWMNAADLFVLVSYTEGNPTVMFECFGCGLPFIGTNVGGIAEIITSNRYGFVCEDPEDKNELLKLINEGLQKKWEKEEIKKYSKKFTWKNISNKIYETIK